MKSLEKFLERTGRMDNRVCMFYVADRLDDIINGEDPKKFRDECIYNLGVNARWNDRCPAVDPKPSKGVALREWLRDSGLSALEFSRRLDVSQPTLSRWMLGKALPTVDHALKIEAATGGAVSCDTWRKRSG